MGPGLISDRWCGVCAFQLLGFDDRGGVRHCRWYFLYVLIYCTSQRAARHAADRTTTRTCDFGPNPGPGTGYDALLFWLVRQYPIRMVRKSKSKYQILVASSEANPSEFQYWRPLGPVRLQSMYSDSPPSPTSAGGRSLSDGQYFWKIGMTWDKDGAANELLSGREIRGWPG